MRAEALKGHLDGLLLAVLESGPAHGYAVIEVLRSVSGGTFDLPTGTVYPALRRLEEDGLVASAWDQPPGERKRRVYQLTAPGRTALATHRQGWQRFSGAVTAVLAGETSWVPAN
ncbi:PadR family transcriptional regulator [Catelliglobosispora koreensis]|uniref:PadR family transcriptional regulator n=1 Tax=Catelliglobosispora koreensis TaxID=129052 RepID=UPI00036F47C0|nr:helix-turn-helix transcriptional regulator [Catelliglobosispora koreensis]